MDGVQEQPEPKLGRFGRYWLYGLLGLLGLSFLTHEFDRTTVLYSPHNFLGFAFLACGITGLVSAGVGIWQSAGRPLWRRVHATFALWFVGTLSTFFLFSSISSLIQNALDFPPEKVRTFDTYLRIGRAYRAYGKPGGWVIQPEPIWGNIDIKRDDFEFMAKHRRPGDPGNDPDEISSKGYFCAHVTMQQSGKSFRVMHAGSHALPRGSVVVCPEGQSTFGG